MAARSIYATLRERIEKDATRLAEHEKRAYLWFTRYQESIMGWQNDTRGGVDFDDVRRPAKSRQVVRPSSAEVGAFYFFLYRPMNAQTLPYYDMFPLVVPIERYQDGFLGINFHYLNYRTRARFFDSLYRTLYTERRDPLRSRLSMDYDTLDDSPKYEEFRPCVRRYHHKQFRSPLLQVPDHEWVFALFLPVEMFKKRSRGAVWVESDKKIE
mgnify:FL=1